MIIQTTFKNHLGSLNRPNAEAESSPSTEKTAHPGLLVGIEDPPEPLASAAQEALGLPILPNSLLVGIPYKTLAETPLEEVMAKTGVAAAKLVSKELAAASGIPAIKYGVNTLWLGVNLWKLYDRWQGPEKDIPALLIDTTSTALSAAQLGSDLTGFGDSFFGDEVLQENLGVFFTASKALAKDEDMSLALVNRQIGKTDLGKVLGLVSPMLNAAASATRGYENVTFKPMPQFANPVSLPPDGLKFHVKDNVPSEGQT